MRLLSLLNLGSAMPKVKEMGRYNLARPQLLPAFGSRRKSGGVETHKPEAKPEAAFQKPVLDGLAKAGLKVGEFEQTAARLWICVQDGNAALDRIGALK